jgi:glycosyltransferase involved in cell wall biosynthesis
LSSAHVVHVLGTGDALATGIARTALNVAESLDPNRYRISVFFLRDDGAVGDRLRQLGVGVAALGWTRGRADIRGALRFARALRDAKPDIVHLHAGGLSPRFISKVTADARVVVHYHSLEEEARTKGRSRRSSLAADLVIANSEATARSVRGTKPLIVYPGVAIPTVRETRESGEIRIGVAARLAPVKGISFFVDAMKSVAQSVPQLRAEIAGDGPERTSLENQVRARELEQTVTFAGWVDDISQTMRGWDIYVQPSLAEGLGISALEAMACGIPVVASNVGGLKEIIVDGVTGFLVPPGDARALAETIWLLTTDAALRASMGNAARARVIEHFNLERESHAIRTVYERLLA